MNGHTKRTAAQQAQERAYRVQAWGSNFEHLADQFWAMMNEMGGPNYFRSHAPHSWTPKLNLYQTPERFIVCVELAGMPREEIDVRAVEKTLHIRGSRKKPDLPDGEREPVSVDLMEIDSGRFHRKVPIPRDVIIDDISAAYRHGYLWVLMPRAGSDPPDESKNSASSSGS